MRDLEAVVASSIAAAEGGGSEAVDTGSGGTETAVASSESTTDSPTAAAAAGSGDGEADKPAVAGETKPAAAVEEDAPDLTEQELAGQTLPVHRHKAVLTKARKKTEALTKELEGLAWAKSPETVDKLRALDLADQQPETFAKILIGDAKFGPILRKALGVVDGAAPAAASTDAAASVAAADDETPLQPDVLLPDGSVGYTAATIDKRFTRELNRMKKELTKDFEQKFGKVEPLVDEHARSVQWNEAIGRQKQAISHAKEHWPGFTAHFDDVKKFVLTPGNERVSLLDAYMKIVVPKLQGNEEAIRRKVLSELNTREAAAHPGPRNTGQEPPASSGDKIEDAIRRNIAAAEARS